MNHLKGEAISCSYSVLYNAPLYDLARTIPRMTPRKQTAFRLSAAELRLLAKMARGEESSQSQIVRDALRFYARAKGYIK